MLHGFGAVGDNIILLIQFNGSVYDGITNNTGYTFEVIDADTVKILGEAIFGTTNPQLATLTPQLAPLTNVNIIGNNIQPTVINQVILGNDQITSTLLKGVVNINQLGTASGAVEPLGRDANGDVVVAPAGLAITGTPNRVAKFNAQGDNVADSQIFDDATNVIIGATAVVDTTSKLEINGRVSQILPNRPDDVW